MAVISTLTATCVCASEGQRSARSGSAWRRRWRRRREGATLACHVTALISLSLCALQMARHTLAPALPSKLNNIRDSQYISFLFSLSFSSFFYFICPSFNLLYISYLHITILLVFLSYSVFFLFFPFSHSFFCTFPFFYYPSLPYIM